MKSGLAGTVSMGLLAVQTGWSQLPIWIGDAKWVEERSGEFQSWSAGQSLRLGHARLLPHRGHISAEWLQIGSYLVTGLSAGHMVELAPQLSMQARAGFRYHRWQTTYAVLRRIQPEIEALLRAELDACNRLLLAFRFSPHGALPVAQARDEMNIQSEWALSRGAFAARATVNWSNRGTSLQWRLMRLLEGQGAIGLHWMPLSGFLGIECWVIRPSNRWSISISSSARMNSAALKTEWHW